MKFKLISNYKPSGDQPKAIQELNQGIKNNEKYQTLLGVTGSGKTFTMANVIEQNQKPTLILSHNKTLTAQLYREFKEFFPHNAVEYFVSYYDYYQPEAYVPATDTYIQKDTSINEEIDRMRLSATSSLLERKDVIIVASISCIYGLGSPKDYKKFTIYLENGMEIKRKELLKKLIIMQYYRNDNDFSRSTFRVKGDVLEIHPAYAQYTIRIDFFGDEIDSINRLEIISAKIIEKLENIIIYPAKHFVTSKEKINKAIKTIKIELNKELDKLKKKNKTFEAHRLYSRTIYDIEMLKELGYCNGIENYSSHLSEQKPGEAPATLIDYFPKNNFILFIDESHVTISQLKGMYNGNRSRKQTLIDFGFRLPSALDNRPLKIDEFKKLIPQTIYISATPGEIELESSNKLVEQIIRPTGLLEPSIEIYPTKGQIENIISQINKEEKNNIRTLITTLTKRMSEDLAEYLNEQGIKTKYLHSEIETIERVEILKDLRLGKFTCLIGINLLREGIDLPEVGLVIILDADKIGFLRSTQALIQTAGRAARNVNGHVIMYADKISQAMQNTIDETKRRRTLQIKYNLKHKIKPKSIKKNIKDILERSNNTSNNEKNNIIQNNINQKYDKKSIIKNKKSLIINLQKEMIKHAKKLNFEKAAQIRDKLNKLKK